MEKTTRHENDELSEGFEQAVREFEDAHVRIEKLDIASRERVDLAEITSNERMQFAKLDALVRLARYAFECLCGRFGSPTLQTTPFRTVPFRTTPVSCASCAGTAPMPDYRETACRVSSVAADSST